MAAPADDKNSEHDLPKNRQASDINTSGIASEDSRELGGARTGAAAGSLGREVSIALPGAGSKFAPRVNPPEIPPPPVMAFGNRSFEAAADAVVRRRPNLGLNQSSVAGPPFPLASEATASTAVIFEMIQERLRVLEIAFSRMPPPPVGLGHNNPPEPIEDIPLSAAEWTETGQLLAVLEEQTVAHEPIEAKAAASKLKAIAENVLSFLGRHSEEFSSEFAKKAGATAGVAAAGAAAAGLVVLAHYGEASLKTFATDLIEVSNLVEAWVHSLGFDWL